MNPHVWWYVSRASGVVAWGLVTGAVVLGLWLSLRVTKKKPRPAWTLDLHRFLGGLAVVFTGVHLAGLVGDSYVHFGAAELFVPFASTWQPDAVAFGVVALYLLVAIEVTSLAMRYLPRKLWRAVHFTSYAVFALTTIHMLAAGTDAGRRPLQWATIAAIGIVAFLTFVRILPSASRDAPTGTARARAASARARSTAAPEERTAASASPAPDEIRWAPETAVVTDADDRPPSVTTGDHPERARTHRRSGVTARR